jgi:hypothetical protein
VAKQDPGDLPEQSEAYDGRVTDILAKWDMTEHFPKNMLKAGCPEAQEMKFSVGNHAEHS